MESLPPDDPVELGAWVLEHGLAPLPTVLAEDETVAIARWNGEDWGAVLFVSRHADEEDGENEIDTDVQTYRRLDGSWVASDGSGGGGWFDEPLRRPDFPRDYAAVAHFHSTSGAIGSCCAAYGVAGEDASFVEVVTPAGSTVAAIDSPVGAFVVAADRTSDAFVRVLAADQRVMVEQRFAPY